MPIAQFEGKALVFNNGVVDVVQGETSLVDENKVAHIPEGGNVEIDNLTIIKNADDELEVPFDNNTIYRDSEDGFIKAVEPSDHKVILCTKVGDNPAGPVGSFTLNQNSDKTITIPIPQGGGGSYTAGDGIQISNDEISVDKTQFISRQVTRPEHDFSVHFDPAITGLGHYVQYDYSEEAQEAYDWIMQYNPYIEGTVSSGGGLWSSYGMIVFEFTIEGSDGTYGWENFLKYTDGNFTWEIHPYEEYIEGEGSTGRRGFALVADLQQYGDAPFEMNVTSASIYNPQVESWVGGPMYQSGFLYKENNGIIHTAEPQVPRYYAGNGIEIYDDEEVRVKSDNTTLEATSTNLHIKDGVLPKVVNDMHPQQYTSIDELVITNGVDTGNDTWDFTTTVDISDIDFSKAFSTYIVIYDTDSNSTTADLRGRHFSSVENYKRMTGGFDSGWSSYVEMGFGIDVNTNEIHVSVPKTIGSHTVSDSSVMISLIQDAYGSTYIDLGSQIGSGWEQGRDYYLIFRDGKLILQ